MSTLSTARRGLLAPGVLAAVLLGAAPLLSACGSGKKAPTRLEYEVADGVRAAAGNVVLRNLQLLADTGETQGGATALQLTGVIANNTGKTDSLTGVTADSGGQQLPFGESTASSGSASASASGSASAAPSASAAAPSASASAAASSTPAGLSAVSASIDPATPLLLGSKGTVLRIDLPKPVLPGSLVPVTFTFENSGSTTVAVPVIVRSSQSAGASASPVTYPAPDLPQEFNQSPYDLRSAAPSS